MLTQSVQNTSRDGDITASWELHPFIVRAKSLQLCPTLCSPMDCSPQAPLSMGFSRQEYWSGLPCPLPGELPDSGIEPTFPMSSALADGFFTTSATWEALPFIIWFLKNNFIYLTVLGLCCTRVFSSCSKQGLLSSCGMRASHCSGFSCFRAQALEGSGFSSCGSWALEQRLSSCGTWA